MTAMRRPVEAARVRALRSCRSVGWLLSDGTTLSLRNGVAEATAVETIHNALLPASASRVRRAH